MSRSPSNKATVAAVVVTRREALAAVAAEATKKVATIAVAAVAITGIINRITDTSLSSEILSVTGKDFLFFLPLS
jgi:hypothetical protein